MIPVIIKANDTEIKPVSADRPSTSEVRSGRYGARAKSSNTKIVTIRFESSERLQPDSRISSDAIPEDET